MADRDPDRDNRRLEDNKREIERHLVWGWERIIAWYEAESEEEREEVTEGLMRPPHEAILEKGLLYIEVGVNLYDSGGVMISGDEEELDTDLYYMFIAIGSEYLLNAIVLQEVPNYFKDNTSERWRSPNFKGLIEKVSRDLLSCKLTKEQQDIIFDTLQIVGKHRNNIVHLGFHSHTHSYHPGVIHYVLAFLLKEFFEEEEAVLELLYHADADHYIDGDYQALTVED